MMKLPISDDEKLNTEIRERIGYDEEYFSSAEKALAYGIHQDEEDYERFEHMFLYIESP